VSRCAEKARLDQEAVWAVLAPTDHRPGHRGKQNQKRQRSI